MNCPNDSCELREEAPGVYECRRCHGRAIRRSAFAAVHRDVDAILQREDAQSGAFARQRSCPVCKRPMTPLRLGIQKCWIESCSTCSVLWVEKLDAYVIERLDRRIAIERAVREIPPDERRKMAAEMAHDAGELERTRQEAQLMKNVNQWFRWARLFRW